MSNEWFDRGELPPVGAVVDYSTSFFSSTDRNFGVCTVLAYHVGKVWIDISGSIDFVISLDVIKFRPIKTDKEKAIEAALSVMSTKTISNTQRKTINKLYDAGLLRLPEDKK